MYLTADIDRTNYTRRLYLHDEEITELIIPEGITNIESGKFSYFKNLVSITLPTSLKSIEEGAFTDIALTIEVHIPDIASWLNISHVGRIFRHGYDGHSSYYLYVGNEKVTNFVVPEGTTTIPKYTFYHCLINSVTIPSSVTSIEEYAFYGASLLRNLYISDIAAWCNCEMSSHPFWNYGVDGHLYLNNVEVKDLSIPAGVKEMTTFCFQNCSNIQSVSFPESLTEIGGYAFSGCKGIKSISFPQSLTGIGGGAFMGCSNLSSVQLPQGLTYLGNAVFQNCLSITSIVIPNNVAYLGNYLMYNCTSLTSFTFPDGIKTIPNSMFCGCTSLSSIVIPNTVETIEKEAFGNCTSLSSIVIPNTVETIEWEAFYGCTSLMSVSLPKNLSVMRWNAFSYSGIYNSQNDGPIYIGDWCCGYKGLVQENGALVIREGTRCISPNENFVNQAQVASSLVIPNSVELIMEYKRSASSGSVIPFTNMAKLKTVSIGDGLTNLNLFNFENSKELESISLGNGITTISDKLFENYKNLSTVTLGTGIQSIGKFAFNGCEKLGEITIPEGVTTIGQYAFANCIGLSSVTSKIKTPKVLDESVFVCEISGYDKRTIYYAATLYVPEGKKAIYQNVAAWNLFSNIQEGGSEPQPANDTFTIDGLTYRKTSDSEVSVSAASTDIRGSVQIPNMVRDNNVMYNVTAVEESAFEGCSSISSITIPASITAIGSKAFAGCSGLRQLTVNIRTPLSISESVFTGVDKQQCTLNVPEGSGDLYRNAAVWKDFWQVASSDESVVEGITYTVSGSGTVTIVSANHSVNGRYEIPETVTINGVEYAVTAIAANAFNGCTGMTAVTIPASITSIGSGAFAGCTNLMEIYCLSSTPIDLSSAFAPKRASSANPLGDIDFENCVLYVPYGTASLYRAAAGWKEFKNIVEMENPSGIDAIRGDNRQSAPVYNLRGQRLAAPQKGINIIGGRKVVVK